ncbi:M48 family metallopeptidase [Pacificimonas sp. ICDLI1SI03]
MAIGWHFDGATAVRYHVRVEARENMLVLHGAGEAAQIVDPTRLQALETRKDARVYGLKGQDGWRLGLPATDDAAIEALLPPAARYGGLVDRFGLAKFAAAATILSAMFLLVFWLAPGWLAPLIPRDMERRIGDALFADLDSERVCRSSGGQEVLDRLTRRLAPGTDIDLRVADIGMANAVTLPGGRIIIFKGLIRQSESADEMAGVLAHEIAHYREHHVTEAMIRQLGLGILINSLGGNTGATLTQFAGLSFSRDAEREADTQAIAYMVAANISPAPTAGFFRRMAQTEEMFDKRLVAAANFLSTHPVSSARAERFEQAGEEGEFTPAMSDAEWQRVRKMCGGADDPPTTDTGTPTDPSQAR